MENVHHFAWDHHALDAAAQSLEPTSAAAVSDAWKALGRDFDAAVEAFRDSVSSALASGWSGEAAHSAGASVDEYARSVEHVGSGFVGVGTALEHATSGAESLKSMVSAPSDRAEGWVRSMPWMWDADEASHEAEQAAKVAVESTYHPALQQASVHLPDLTHSPAAVSSASVLATSGQYVGPDGMHGIAWNGAGTVDPAAVPGAPEAHRDSAPSRDAAAAPMAGGSMAGSSMALGAMAGALGSGAAHYAGQVVAGHRDASAATPSADVPEPEEDDVEPPTFLVEIDEGSAVVGKLPPASPSVIGS